MRKLTLTMLIVLSVAFYACGPTVEQAIKYNDDIIAKHDEISAKMNALTESYDKFIPEEMDKAYLEAQIAIKDGIEFVNKLEPFDNDDSFKAGALTLFNTYKSVLDVENKRLIELMKLPPSQYHEAEVAEYDKLRGQSNKKIDIAVSKLAEIQEKFSKKFKYPVNEK